MLGVVGVLTVEAQGKGPWWEIPGKVGCTHGLAA